MIEIKSAVFKPMEGQIVSFRSPTFNDFQRMAVCTTDVTDKPKPLIVELNPGSFSGMDWRKKMAEGTCQVAAAHNLACISLHVGGRGDGTLFEGYGEVDVYEAIAAVKQLLAVDSDRISVTGASMGGAATWYHISHYPDFWAAGAPYCGYCDYKLWEKPGGTTFHRQEWEEFSWISRDAAYRVENLGHTALRITHGEWDRAVGGGVSVEQSRQMVRKLNALGIPNTYIETPRAGHGGWTPESQAQTVPWLLSQTKVREVDQVSLIVHTLRNNRSYWVAVEQQLSSGKASQVDARFDTTAKRLQVKTTNVLRLALGPLPACQTIDIDGTEIKGIDLTVARGFIRAEDGKWAQTENEIPAGEKRPGLSGPFSDIFFGPTIIVYGTAGSDAENNFNQQMAWNTVNFYNATNGGVHRGGIQGANSVHIPVITDRDMQRVLEGGPPVKSNNSPDIVVDKNLLQRANLFFVGNYGSNSELTKLSDKLPLVYEKSRIQLGGRIFKGEHLAFFAMLPHPDGKRYVAMLSGTDYDAICWGSHVGIQLLPDYLVFDHDRVVEWGFWDNQWRGTANKRE